MKRPKISVAVMAAVLFLFLSSSKASENNQIRLPRTPAISPDGNRIAFAWQNDIWMADSDGGQATRMTIHPATESSPHFSPDGKHIYFDSNRSGRTQIHRMPANGGPAEQITFDSNRKTLSGITSDGRYLLLVQSTDRGWHYSEASRVFLFDTTGEKPKRMLFDAGVRDAALSPDGTRVLFVRGRSNWNRKGYQGPQAAQLWMADLSTQPATLTRLDKDREHFQNIAEMDPMWSDDNENYYFISDPDGVFNIYGRAVGSDETRQVTNVQTDGNDDGVAFASLSQDSDTLLFRRGFGLYKCDVDSGQPKEIKLFATGDGVASPIERQRQNRATSVAFTPDGKQMAFVAGADIYVMDRILKEPIRVTNTAHPETSLTFNSDGSRLFYVSDSGGEIDLWQATHSREDGIWWQADSFQLKQITDDREPESGLSLSPNGSHIAFVKGTNLFVMDDDGSDHRLIAKMWSPPQHSWSPDGKWITYATQDDNYNSDVFIVPLDGTREPFNLSRHPDRDFNPVWSGDGKRIAWVGRRDGEEADIYVVELARETEELTARDERLKKALEAMKPKGGSKSKPETKNQEPKKKTMEKEASSNTAANGDKTTDKDDKTSQNEDKSVVIDFHGIFDRVDRLRYPDSTETSLIWMDDGATLAFSATIGGKRGFYSVKFPRPEAPQKIADVPLSSNRWLAESKQFVGHRNGVPATMNSKGKTESFAFQVQSERDWRKVRMITFDQAWRAMRDRFYDQAYNNKDWYAIRNKYRPMAAQCLGADEFSELMNMMLGELNASHMGHRGGSDPLPTFAAQNEWSPTTCHLGLRFNLSNDGPGMVVESVIPGGPCSQDRSLVKPGETVLSIDGTEVGPNSDLEKLLTMSEIKPIDLKVRSTAGKERTVSVRPVTSVANLLYDEWVEKTRAQVHELSDGKLGYLHIRGMNFGSFRQMEEDLFHAGAGKEGLIIDVRFNGGGSTADHVMTALTQPRHAITRSRGSGEGYPQDRRVYASWTKPIVLMCNEHSFSNAEIVSHAVKQIGRGRLVGMRTAGGVISTGAARLMDGSSIRMPTRGWYLVTTGQDMELNGCEPDIAMWNDPTWNSPGGTDTQLAAAVQALAEDVASEKAKESVKIVPASELRK